MKKAIIFFPFWLVTWAAVAQTGFNYINFSAGGTHPQGSAFTLNYETVTRYHDTWEFGVEYYSEMLEASDSISTGWRKHKSWLFGPVYKPMLVRSKNVSLRLPLGLRAGTNGTRFILAPQAGLELCHAFTRELEIILGQKTQYVFYDSKPWRVGLYVGLRIPIN